MKNDFMKKIYILDVILIDYEKNNNIEFNIFNIYFNWL